MVPTVAESNRVFGVISGLLSGIFSGELDTLAQDDAGFYDVYGMVHRPWWQHPGWKILLCMLALLALIFLITRFYIKRKKEKKHTPWDQALRDIEQAKQGALAALATRATDAEISSGSSVAKDQKRADLASQAGSQFYVELSRILKAYLYERYGFDLLGKTDKELALWAAERPELAPVQAMLSQLLEGGEYIKFAGHQAARDAVERHALVAQGMIKQTMPAKSPTKSPAN
jgi:hypothetical protein